MPSQSMWVREPSTFLECSTLALPELNGGYTVGQPGESELASKDQNVLEPVSGLLPG